MKNNALKIKYILYVKSKKMKFMQEMEQMKINLNNIKVAIFDFDDTLAIHKDADYKKRRNENEENLINYYLNAYN